jgi:hypothetical protein
VLSGNAAALAEITPLSPGPEDAAHTSLFLTKEPGSLKAPPNTFGRHAGITLSRGRPSITPEECVN